MKPSGGLSLPTSTSAAFLFCLCSLLGTLSALNHQASDGCDWSGSGLHHGESSRGIQPVYLRCTQGSLEWLYPRGALRVVLRHGSSNKDFRGCLRVTANSTGARIFLEGHFQLRPLYSKGDGLHRELVRCFTSTHGQVALYVEAEAIGDILRRDILKFSYDLQPVSQRSLAEKQSECRPCTDNELIWLFCSSDFVVRGTISSIYHNSPLQRTELTVRANHVIRDSEPPVFSVVGSFEGSLAQYGELHRPLQCGTKAGSGEFLFLGRWKLGSPVITCAPRWAEWKHVRRKALIQESSQCLLD